jgi:hypothetical protein
MYLQKNTKTNSYLNIFNFLKFNVPFVKKKSGELQRKVGKLGQTSKIIIFVCTLDHN